MEDVNIMTVQRYVPTAPGAPADTGYDSDNRQAIEPSFADVQTVVDYDSENFKYGLGYWEGNIDNKMRDPLFLFQDPLFPTIDVILDTTRSPLFLDGAGGCSQFLTDYGDIYSIRARQKVLSEFKRISYLLFNKDVEKVDRTKAYYINSITGLDKLTARIVDFEKDKITINLNEDVSMMTAYLSHLYNNLSYSYRDQRQMVPANLLRFNMYLKVNDVRNMPWYIPDAGTGYTTSFTKSYQIYLLRDCTFIFKNSKNFDDSITIGGFDAGVPNKASSVNLDVVYKSIEIESEYPFILDKLNDVESSALKLNNKDKDIVGYIDGLNTVYDKYSKTPDAFADELDTSARINNQNDNSVLNAQASNNLTGTGTTTLLGGSGGKSTTSVKNQGQTSSQKGKSDTRESYLKGNNVPVYNTDKSDNVVYTSDTQDYIQGKIGEADVINTNAKGDVVYLSDLQDKRANVIYNDPNVINTDANGNVVYLSDTIQYINDNVNYTGEGDYVYVPSVYQSDWNSSSDTAIQHPQTGIALNVWRDSLLGQLNFGGFLFSLPFNILNMFFGGYHGLPEMYIDTYAPNIPAMEEIHLGTIKPPPTIGLQGEKIDTTVYPVENPMGVIDTTFTPQKPLTGTIDTAFNVQPPLAGTIDTTFITHQPISGSINTSFHPHPPVSGVINTNYTPHPPVSGVIDTSFIPHPSVSGVIDTSFSPHPPVSGVIDTSFTPHPSVDGTIDTTARKLQPISGVIDTTAKKHPSVSGVIDTSTKPRIFNLGYVYTNTYTQREVDLGLLYLPLTKENIPPIIYLYSKVDKFNSLFNYYVYNNAVSEAKPLDIKIDQNIRNISPMPVVYEYDNNIDINKTLNDVTLYNNNIEKTNNITVMNVIGESVVPTPEFREIKLYDNVVPEKSLPMTYLYRNQEEIPNVLDGDRVYSNDTILGEYLNGQKLDTTINPPLPINLGNVIQIVKEEEGIIELGTIDKTARKKPLLEPESLFTPVTKKVVDLGKLYNNNVDRDNILKSKEENVPTKEVENRTKFEEARIRNQEEEKFRDLLGERAILKEYIYKAENIEKTNEMKEVNVNVDPEADFHFKKDREELNNERLR